MKMRFILTILTAGLLALLTAWQSGCARKPVYQSVRVPVDTVGFATRPEDMSAVIHAAQALEKETLSALRRQFPGPWIAGVSPHDDYLYAGRVYIHLLPDIQAKRVVLFGVGHKAWRWQVEDQLIFDEFDAWQAPYGPVAVSGLREELMAGLDPEDYLVSNEFHSEEHSLEALVPWLQYYDRQVEIVPILVPYMDWPRIEALSRKLSGVLADVIRAKGWELGTDIAFLVSNDCVHYGDDQWGGKNYADFGVDEKGYEQAVTREYDLASHLTGQLDPVALKDLLYRLVEEEDVHQYKIPWCGRFSVPLGLNTVHHLTQALGRPALTGHLLRYDTSAGLGILPVKETRLGVTAPSSLRHWVGYAAVGYR